MVAPNGARLTKKDHPAIPTTVSETIVTARRCFEAVAQALHLHVRDRDDIPVDGVRRWTSGTRLSGNPLIRGQMFVWVSRIA